MAQAVQQVTVATLEPEQATTLPLVVAVLVVPVVRAVTAALPALAKTAALVVTVELVPLEVAAEEASPGWLVAAARAATVGPPAPAGQASRLRAVAWAAPAATVE